MSLGMISLLTGQEPWQGYTETMLSEKVSSLFRTSSYPADASFFLGKRIELPKLSAVA